MYYPMMLLETYPTAFSSKDHVFEAKHDGIRLQLAYLDEFKLYTRNGNDTTNQFPELYCNELPKVVLDGEAVVLSPTGNDEFDSILKRFRLQKVDKINYYSIHLPVCYYVFDILHYEGVDVRTSPLLERKKLLKDFLNSCNNPRYKMIEGIEEDGVGFFNRIKKEKMEGMVAKEKMSHYIGRRSKSWLKIINWIHQEVIISGYSKKDNSLLCSDDKGVKIAAVSQGLTSSQLQAFLKVSRKIAVKEDNTFVYIQPLLKASVKCRGYSSNGIMRSPVFIDFIY